MLEAAADVPQERATRLSSRLKPRYARLKGAFRRALQRSPWLCTYRGSLEPLRGSPQRQLAKELARLIDLFPGTPSLWWMSYRLEESRGREEAAWNSLLRACRLDPENSRYEAIRLHLIPRRIPGREVNAQLASAFERIHRGAAAPELCLSCSPEERLLEPAARGPGHGPAPAPPRAILYARARPPPTAMNLLLALLSLLVLLALLTLATRQVQRYRIRRAWRELAPRLELSLVEGQRLSGRYRGSPLEVVLEGRASQVRMAIQGELPPGLHLSRQQPGARRLRGVRDIHVGDPPLDDAVLVQATHPAATIRLLREPAVRDSLLGLLAEHPRAVVTGSEVVIPLEKRPDEELGRRLLRAQQRLASALGDSASRLSEQAREAREQARLEPLPPARQPSSAPRQPEPSEPPLRALREDFARRRWIHGILSYPAIATGWVMVLIGNGVRRNQLDLDISWPTWEFVGVSLFIAGGLVSAIGGYFLIRCPACGGTLARNSRFKPFETEVCPHCQMRLS